MLKLSDILDLVKTYHPQPDLDLIRKAYVCSAKYHEGQVRKSGEPYLSHPLEVAKILAELKLDEASICTGLLHDTVEDTAATQDEIEEVFGHDIAYLVDGVTKLSQIKFYSSEEKQAENFRKMLVAMSRDIRVLLVKLADRLHNMRTLQYMIPEKQERIATETIEIYAPLANRLGIAWLKAELEDLSFKYIKPWDYRNLREKIGKTKNERARFIEDVSRELEKTLNDAGMKNFEVEGRPKHLWSVFRKMSDK
ncbi:MAG: bifunctional (p)ppGpp synthetase/guanosine-3',5'-bis(diphosphate) 3'-pyrophosphohydrolase, partial [Myxococcales bacterium]|nr:bifunctional (p)ppGpp synthetase/guanosine-3',5'-bis(diphosphate) 3'-pyrophosphohydrolase [Myxococcales bacterium]